MSPREQALQDVLVAYVEADERGNPGSLKDWQSRHPDFAAELAAFAANRQQLDRLVGPLRQAAESALARAAADRTLGLDEQRAPTPGIKIRYFGDYELIEEVGRGGMGVVYRARQVSLKRIVALKMILAGQLADEQDVRRFLAEAQAAAKLDHPGIVPVFEVGQHEQHHYFTMAFVEGESLAHRLSQSLPPPREAAELLRKVAEAVAYAHLEGVIHRDLKPANILIDQHGQPRLTDFGLAKHVASPGRKLGEEPIKDLTATGQVLGTPSYMAPEQASGKRGVVGAAADVYSLGAILYSMLTGRPPFQAANTLDTLLQVLEREPVAPRLLNSTVPRDLETICLKCLQKEAKKRYASARELAEDLDRYLDGQPIIARPVGPMSRAWRWCKRKPALAGASAVAVAALAMVVTVSVLFGLSQARNAEDNKRKLAESYLDKGQGYCEQGDIARGLLWFTRGLETAPPRAADLQRVIRYNLGAWQPDTAHLKASLEKRPEVVRVAFASDSRRVMLSAQDRTVKLLDATTGQLAGAVIQHKGEPHSAALSPDGKIIVTGSQEHGIPAVMWDARTGQQIRPLQLHPPRFTESGTPLVHGDDLGAIHRSAFSADGKVLATSDLMTIQLWEAATGKPLGTRMQGHTDWIESLAVSPDGKLIATGSRDGTARLWDATTSKALGEPLLHLKGTWVSSMAFSPDGKTLLTGCHHGTARLWDVATGKLIREPTVHSGWVWTVAFSGDGSRYMTGVGGGENTARLWDTATGKLIGMPLSHDSYVNAVAISPDGQLAVTAMRTQTDKDATVKLWELPGRQAGDILLKHDAPIQSVAFHPSGSLIAVSSHTLNPYDWHGSVRLWDAAAGRAIGVPLPHKGPVQQLLFSADGKVLVAVMDADWKEYSANERRRAAEIHLWNVETRQPARTPLELWGEVPHVVFGTDGMLVVTDVDGTITDWDVATGKPVGGPRKGKRPMREESRSPDGQYVFRGNGVDNLGFLYRRDKSNLDGDVQFAIGTIQPPGGITVSAFSPDGSLLLTAGGAAILWDVATLKPIGRSFGQASAVAFNPDGKTLLTAGADGVARLWKVPIPPDGDVERLTLWVQVQTSSHLVQQARYVLQADEWEKRRQRLEALGGPPER
jgi:WD40 repeat protein